MLWLPLGGEAGLSCASFWFSHPKIAAVESFLRHINGQVRQGEEQESLMAVAQRIGPYEVLEPSSEEVEKVRKRTPKMPGSRERRWRGSLAGRGQRYLRVCPSWVCPSFLPVGGAQRVDGKNKEGTLAVSAAAPGTERMDRPQHKEPRGGGWWGVGWRGSPARCPDALSSRSLFP